MAGLKIGGTDISDVRVGSTQVKAVYQGSNLVWQAVSNPTFHSAFGVSDSNSLALSGLSEGQMLVYASADANVAYSMSSTGWSGINASFPSSNFENGIQNVTAYKTVGVTPDTSVSLNKAIPTQACIALSVGAFQSVGYVVAAGSSITPPAVTVNVDGSAVVILAYLDANVANITQVPSGYTLAVEENSSTSGLPASVATFYKENEPAGTESPGQLTWSSSASQIARTVVINPA